MTGKQFRVKDWKELLKLGGLLDDGSIKMDYLVFDKRYAQYCGMVETVMAYDDRYIISTNGRCYPRNAVTILTDYNSTLYKVAGQKHGSRLAIETILLSMGLVDSLEILAKRQDGQNIDNLSYSIAKMEVALDLLKEKYKISDADIQKKKEKWIGELEK